MTATAAFFPLIGGLDLVTPPINTPAGRVLSGSNYEPHPRGYQRIEGYERLDGRPKPSEASYWVLEFSGASAEVLADDSVDFVGSGASAIALIDAVLVSGDYGDSSAAGYIVLTDLSGMAEPGDTIEVNSNVVAIASSKAYGRWAAGDGSDNDKTWLIAAMERRRALIEPVPGNGPVRGVWTFKGNHYAFRDDDDEGVMYKATIDGWEPVPLGEYIEFDDGTAEFADGEVLTGGTSTATATIERVVWESGTWGEGSATGRLILSNIDGTFEDDETITSDSGSATSSSVALEVTLPPGGRYQFSNGNFFATSSTLSMYGVNGVGEGFEFNGEVFVPIRVQGMEDRYPTRLAIHQNHLFYAYPGGSLQHSSLGNPYQWQVVTGAGEIGIGEDITDLAPSVSGAMAIFAVNRVAVLTGSGSASWDMRIISDSSGARPWTVQAIGAPIYQDSQGLRSLQTTEQFGDFNVGSVTRMIEPIFRRYNALGVQPVASLRVRAKDHYRLFLSNGSGIVCYFGREDVEIMQFDLGLVVTCASSEKDDDSQETLLLGGSDGMVYQLDSGTSFDGLPIYAFVRFPFNHIMSPAQHARFQKVTLELDAAPDTMLGVVCEFSYGETPSDYGQNFLVGGSGGFWDESPWDEFYWSSSVEGRAERHIDGLGRNISVVVASESVHELPHTLHGCIINYAPRGLVK